MIRLLLIGLLFFTALCSKEVTHSQLQKVLYLSFKEMPQRVIKGEIFSITLKTLSTVKNFTNITYKISNHRGLEILNDTPSREKDSKYYYDTFYFLTTSSRARIPNFRATLHSDNKKIYKKTTLVGKKLKVVTLNPKKNFSNIIADSFAISEYKTTTFDEQHNIIVFVATATNCDIKSFRLQGPFKQGIESTTGTHFDSKIIYYAVINKKLEKFSFSYFNLKKNRFMLLNIPIIVVDDSVTTQSDLKPKDQSKERLKMSIAAVIAFIASIFILWRRRYVYLVFIIIPLVYIAYIAIPSKEVCIKAGAEIYLLPVHNGTIFEKSSSEYHLQKEGSVKDFIKVKLKNEKIGWVKNEDICTD